MLNPYNKVMARILIKNKIATELKKFAPRILPGKSIPVELANGDFEYETTEEIKNDWNSLNESLQKSCIIKYVQEHKDLEEIIKETMRGITK